MTDYAKYHVHSDVVVLTYGQQPCPHAYDRREFQGRVWWTIPRAITVALGGDHQAICVACIVEQESPDLLKRLEESEQIASDLAVSRFVILDEMAGEMADA